MDNILNYARGMVSRTRRRLKEDGVDLDLTYITNRIIATSYPAQGMESYYRNSLTTVAGFLNERHKNKYWVINCSERATYDKGKFGNRVTEYHWPDHHAPPFDYLFAMAKQANDYLRADPANVLVVHCNSGKGRTGSTIASILLYMGYCQTIEDCVKVFNAKRFTDNKGVSQPCQLRYCYYFEGMFNRMLKSPCSKRLKGIHFSCLPNAYQGGWYPKFEVFHCDGL